MAAACRTSSSGGPPAMLLVFLGVTSLLLCDGDRNVAATQKPLQPSSLLLGSAWRASNLSYMASPASIFCFGWLELPTGSHNYFVAVWYASYNNTIVWVANRDSPAADNDTLQFTVNGNLVIPSVTTKGSTPVWETNTSSIGVLGIQILDSGNVVLLRNTTSSSSSSASYAWQSFSSPTDTLLPSQSFLATQTLVSRPPAYSISVGSGTFKFYIKAGVGSIDYIDTASGTSIATVWQAWQSVVLSVSTMNNSAIAGQFNDSGFFTLYNSSGVAQSQLVSSDYGVAPLSSTEPAVRRLTLDPDGNLRIYGWDYASLTWVTLCEAMTILCFDTSTKGVAVCGAYGVCVDAPKAACACPPGFHPTDASDVSLGCSPDSLPLPGCENQPTNASAGSSNSGVAYLALYDTDFYGNDIRAWNGMALEACQNLCTKQCSCVGLIYDPSGSATCWLKNTLTNGYSPNRQLGSRDAYIKLWNFTTSPVINPPEQSPILEWINSSSLWSRASLQSGNFTQISSPTTNTSGSSLAPSSNSSCSQKLAHRSTSTVVTGLVISAVELLCFLLALFILQKTGLICCGRRDQVSSLEQPGCRAFTYADIVQATENFNEPLGAGAFGEVFKGVLPDGREIAVKRLIQVGAMQVVASTHDQFKVEITTLGRIHHVNLVRLYGYCAEGHHRLLVYEFMENGSMNSFLFEEENESVTEELSGMRNGQSQRLLSWKTRYNICLGTARALAYLHEDCLDCIVHCDIKPENILLDLELQPKVGDFGVAYLFGRNETLETTTIRGTRGYLAPEWLAYSPITAKADVFSYGMLLIEIVSGRRNFRFFGSEIISPVWVFRQVESRRLEEVLDPRIRTQVNLAEVEKVLRIAFLCLHQEATARPSMRTVVQMLEGSVELPALPHGPGSLHDQAERGVRVAVPPNGYERYVGPRLQTSTPTTRTSRTSSSTSSLDYNSYLR